MKTKTNQEIMAELQTRGRFKSPAEVEKFFLEALEAKDEEARLEKIELVESMPIDDIKKEIDYSHVAFYDRDKVKSFDNGRMDKNKENLRWKTEKLNQLKP